MSIASYLINQRRKLIRGHKWGFGPDISKVPAPELVSNLKEMRQNDFLTFRRGLREDGVVILKVLTAVDLPALQEGLVICNLRGESQLINLSEISKMADDERRSDARLEDLKTLIADPNTFKIVEGVSDLEKLGERIFQKVKTEDLVPLSGWHPKMRAGFLPTVLYEFPGRYEALTVAFRGEQHPGWRWQFGRDPEILSEEQRRLGYAIASSLISLAMDGIVFRMLRHEFELKNVSSLGQCLTDLMQEEVLLFHETHQMSTVELSDGKSESEEGTKTKKKKLRFKIFDGVKVAESLPGRVLL